MIHFNVSQSNLLFFGKVPHRGDFVRSSQGTAIIQGFDQWISGAMEMLSTDPRWKTIYDSNHDIDFAFFGNDSKHLVAGTLTCSQDSSARRFPFMCAGSFEAEALRRKWRYLPLHLSHIWSQTRLRVRQGVQENAEMVQRLSEAVLYTDIPDGAVHNDYDAFIKSMSIESVQALLTLDQQPMDLRQSILGLGLLLQPVLANRGLALNKSIVLPLPDDDFFIPLLSSFWLDLLQGFTNRMEAEFCLFNVGRAQHHPHLCLGFNGASSKALHSIFMTEADDHQINIAQAEWVEQYIETDYGLKKLSTYLQHPELSLDKLKETFYEVFLGM